jgi:hypothetical protein
LNAYYDATPSPHSQVRRIAVLKLKAQIKAFGYHDGAGGWVYVHQRGDVYEGVAEGCHRLVAMQELYAEEPEPEKEKYQHMRARVLKDVSPQWLGIFCQREFLRSRWHDIMCMCALPLILLASKVCWLPLVSVAFASCRWCVHNIMCAFRLNRWCHSVLTYAPAV